MCFARLAKTFPFRRTDRLRRLHADDVPARVRIEAGGAVVPRGRCGAPAALLARDGPAPVFATGHHIPIDGSARNAPRVLVWSLNLSCRLVLLMVSSIPDLPFLNRTIVCEKGLSDFGSQHGVRDECGGCLRASRQPLGKNDIHAGSLAFSFLLIGVCSRWNRPPREW